MKKTSLLLAILLTFIMLSAVNYRVDIEIHSMEIELNPYVNVIDEDGKNTIVVDEFSIDGGMGLKGIEIKKTSTEMDFDVQKFSIKLPHNIIEQCRINLRNPFSLNSNNAEIGMNMPPVIVKIYKKETLVSYLVLTPHEEYTEVRTTLVNVSPQMFRFPKAPGPLWEVCSIVPKYNKIDLLNRFYPWTQIISGRIWNPMTGKPVSQAVVSADGIEKTLSDSLGYYWFKYEMGDNVSAIQAKYLEHTSELSKFYLESSDKYFEYPRIVNIELGYVIPPPPPPAPEIQTFSEAYQLTFEFDSALLSTGKENTSILKKLMKQLEKLVIVSDVKIVGHTDSIGATDYNYDLSYRRAESVLTYLKEKCKAPFTPEILGFGEAQPIDDNETKEGREMNRRVEISFQHTGEKE
ncbi:MAG: OmpA family protein [Candidatus Zophobacter franzmannii]|nr:OmpA family protein [Candidatus Zophobacter franzmannii]